MGKKTLEIILGQGELEFEFTVREHGGTADGRSKITYPIELVAPNSEKTGKNGPTCAQHCFLSEFKTHG